MSDSIGANHGRSVLKAVKSDTPTDSVAWNVLRPDPAVIDGRPIEMHSRPRAVLLALLLEPNLVVSTDRLSGRLWGDHPPKTARNSIARFVADLRRSLGDNADRVTTARGGYRIIVRDGEHDLERVQALLAECASLRGSDELDELAELSERLGAELSLAGVGANPLLSGLVDSAAIEHGHSEVRIALLEALAETKERLGLQRDLVGLLETAVAAYPFHESLWKHLMVSLDAASRTVEALRAGQRLRGVLADVGILVSPAIVEVEQGILGHLQGGAATEVAGTSNATAISLRIPDPGTSLAGRIDDLRELHRCLQSHPLVSVVGLGGSGKTRLALAMIRAHEATGTTVHQVNLRAVSDPVMVTPTVGAVIGVLPGLDGGAVGLARSLSPDPSLVVLDNCEHVRDACADLVAALVQWAPQARVLVTSRIPLGLAEEYVVPTRPLMVDEPAPGVTGGAPAVELFIDRSNGLLGPEPLDDTTRETITDICRALSGLPLAIEIAAAQLAFASPAEIRERVHDRFEPGSSIEMPSVDALEEVLDWTWKLLTPSQQALLARLSVFESGWTREAMDAVAGSTPTADADIDRLIETCVVTATETAIGARFTILAPVREFAARRLADRGEVRLMLNRLADWMIAFSSRWTYAEHHATSDANRWLLPELGNITTALAHLKTEGRGEDLILLARNAAGMWTNHRFPEESIRWMRPMIEQSEISDQARSVCATSVSLAYHTMGNLEHVAELGTRALELATGEPLDWIPGTAGYLAIWSVVGATPLTTAEYSQMSLDCASQTPSPRLNRAIAAVYRGQLEFIARRYQDALEWYARSLVDVQVQGRLLMLAETGHALSLYMLGRRAEAAEAARNWTSRSDTDHWHYIVDVIRFIIIGGSGEPEWATAELAEAVRSQPSAMVWGQADIVQTAFALLADYRGEHDLAAELFATAANRDLQLVALTVEHLLEQRGLSTDDDWLSVAAELWTRVVPEGARAHARSTANLVSWWSSGVVETQPEPVRPRVHRPVS